MSLISLQFGLFFLSVLAVYYIVPLRYRWTVLLAGSAAFYLLSATPYTALYLVFSIISIYAAANYIGTDAAKHKRAIYFLTLGGNVALLIVMKYVDGLWSVGIRIASLIDISLPPFSLGLLAPLGISFYTLQMISYLTDVYWGISSAQKNPAKLALFASYFPSIGSGPILRYHQVESTLFEGNKASYQNITFGMQRMLWGLFKKLVIAERMALISTPIFADIDTYNGVWLWVGLFAASIQVYADFSGNIDFILGVSESFGVKLPENFKQPFFSLTVQEFFQRWHITLGTWLKDCIMFPLLRTKLFVSFGKFIKKRFGKQAAKVIPPIIAMFVLWLANGVWHGAYLKYIATALWFWFAVTAGQLLEPVGAKVVKLLQIRTDCFSWRLLQRVRTFLVYSIGILFFTADGIIPALRYAKKAIVANNIWDLLNYEKILQLVGGNMGLLGVTISMMLLLVVETYEHTGSSVILWLSRQNAIFRYGVYNIVIMSIYIFGIFDMNQFIYFQF